jgi:membrane protease YdiL (CAAX protease family)
MNIDPIGVAFLGLICLMVPWAAFRSSQRLRVSQNVPRRAYITSVVFTQGIMLALALAAASRNWVFLFPAPTFTWNRALLGAAVLLPALATIPIRWHYKSDADRQRLAWMVPRRWPDMAWWVPISFLAGIGEEIVYRGVAFELLERLFGAWYPAAAICVLAFSLAHYVQGAIAILTIAVLSAALHVIVRATGDLYTVMAVHVLYDILAGTFAIYAYRWWEAQPRLNPMKIPTAPATPDGR